VGWARGSQFVFSQHCKACRGVGIPEEKIQAIPHWQVADCFAPVERALLAYTDALVLMGGRVADGIFAAMKKHLSEEEILEFTYITALYDLHAVTTKALKLEYDDVPERIVEVAAPADAKGDPMGLIDRR
jgi:alkylhydroperoxidase family enzyme